MGKKLILVSAPPASGKTFVSVRLAKALKHVVYLDKDDLVPLSNVAFEQAHEPNDRNGPFYQKYIRGPEYDVIFRMGLSALKYEDTVLINAPFGKEIRDEKWIANAKARLKKDYNAELVVVWVITDIENVRKRMIRRNSPRDEFKLKDWEGWLKTQNFSIPEHIKEEGNPLSLILFYNNNATQFQESLHRTVELLEGKSR